MQQDGLKWMCWLCRRGNVYKMSEIHKNLWKS